MAITQVRAQVNGVWYNLTYDAAQRCYVAEIPAGETSADQPGGWYNVTVEASNDVGESVSIDGDALASLRLVVKDLTAPTVTLVSPPQGYVTTQTPEIVVDLTDDSSGIDISTLAVTIDGEPESSVSTAAIAGGYRATITPTLADGLHTVEISVNDQDGNTGTLVLLYTVDTAPPVLAVWDHRLVVDDEAVLIRGMAQDSAGASVTASASGWTGETAPDADGAWRLSVPLAVGVNEITVTATDGAGLTSTWTGTVVRLITDRVQADLDAVRAILARLNAGTGSAADLAAINSPTQRGAYNDTDLNRVIAAADLVYQSLVDQGLVVDYVPMDPEFPQDGQLPEGYTELEYIESTGTQYIDSGVPVGPNTIQGLRVIADISINYQDNVWAVSGCGNGNPTFYVGCSGSNQFAYGNGMTDIQTGIAFINGRHLYDLNVPGKTYYVDSIVSISDITFAIPSASRNFFISAYSTADIGTMLHAEKIYRYAFFSNSQLIRDFIPCKTPSGEVGLYDTVGQQFYGNAGTGAFTAGPEVPAPPPVVGGPWAEGDIPTQSQIEDYLNNVVNLFQARLVQAQYITLPASMANLTLAGANNIEWALVCVDAVTPVVRKSYIYSGEAMAGEF